MARDLDEIADELYRIRPEGFAAARDGAVREARIAGRQELARDLSKLRRPTQSAWLVNILWRDQRATMEHFFNLADDLRRAQADANIPELQRLTAQRRELESELLRRARRLGEEAGVNVTASLQRDVEDTLAAALALPGVADEVRTGRLLKPASYAGFGADVPAEEDDGEAREPETSSASPRQPTAIRDETAAGDRRRADAEHRVQEARAALEVAAAEVVGLSRAADAAQQHHQALRNQLDELQREMRALRDEVVAAERAALAATRRREQAEKEQDAAAKALERAEGALKESGRRAPR